MDDYHAYKSTGGGSGNSGGGGGFGCGWVVIVVVVIMLLFFIFSGASWEAVETLLALGFIAFLFVKFSF